MKKRKASVERNPINKQSLAHLSVVSPEATNTTHSRSAKPASINNSYHLNLSDKPVKFKNNQTTLSDKGNRMQASKARFNSRDRSREARLVSSPRLKSFPAERIKKLDNPSMCSPEPIGALIMQQNPQETDPCFMDSLAGTNNNCGCAMAVPPLPLYQQSQQLNPQSESSVNRQIAFPERQVHCPFASNILQGPDNHNQSQDASILPQQLCNGSHNETSVIDANCEKQLVDQQNAINRKQRILQSQQNHTQSEAIRNVNTPLNDRSMINHRDIHRFQLHPFHANSHKIYEQMQHSPYYQHNFPVPYPMQLIPNQQQQIDNHSGTCCGYYSQQPCAAPQVFGQAMVSPQDMKLNQMRLTQHNLPVHQQNFQYPINPQSPSWSQNGYWMQAPKQHQLPSYWQQWCQTPEQNTNFNAQDIRSHGPLNPLDNQLSNKSFNERSIKRVDSQQDDKVTPHFTSDMIRDQEMLISTMKQQCVPEAVMRRQFDAMLKEQRRHLAYIAQFQRGECNPEKTNRLTRKSEKDNKPEWMTHITPPWISYSDIERMKAQEKFQKDQFQTDNPIPKEVRKTISAQHQTHHAEKEDTVNHINQSQQINFQPYPHQTWQVNNCPCGNSHQMPYGYDGHLYDHQQNAPVANNPYHYSSPVFNGYNQQQNLYQSPHNVHCNPYHSHSEQQKVSPKESNLTTSSTTDNPKGSIDPGQVYECNDRSTESSSLLKMRVYKEMIRPQKRNNGLQDPNTIQRSLEMLKDPASKKGLEYLANLAKKKPVVRLNGAQNPNEMQEHMQSHVCPAENLTEISSQAHKRISANGLENMRNPDNPLPCVPRPNRTDESMMTEYPRQRQNPRTCYSVQTERDNVTAATLPQEYAPPTVVCMRDTGAAPCDRQNLAIPRNNAKFFQYGDVPSQHYHQMQQHYHGNQNLATHGDGQGDIASTQRPDALRAMKIDRPDGDSDENKNVEEAMNCIGGAQLTQGTNVCAQPEINEVKTFGGSTHLARKPSYISRNITAPDELIASTRLQTPIMF